MSPTAFSPLVGAFPAGISVTRPVRRVGAVALDNPPQCWLDDIIPTGSRDVQTARLANRTGRMTRVREDAQPVDVELRGQWFDGGGTYFRDFAAALESQQQVAFDLGDGTEFAMVDVLDIVGTRAHPTLRDAPGQEGDPWGWVAKVISYEPYTRAQGALISPPLALLADAGVNVTTFNAAYAGTAPGEPSWQFSFIIPPGQAVSQITLQNLTSGEMITVPLALGAGSFTVLVDASGADGGASPRTPNNSRYGQLAAVSAGYGASSRAGGAPLVFTDFSGTPPGLLGPAGQLAPSTRLNAMVATVTATGTVSALLRWLCPTRYRRR